MHPIDTHCHLDFDQYDDDRDKVIETCQNRMKAIVNVGTNFERNQASLYLAHENSFVYATMGLHPTYIKELGEDEVDRIIAQIRENRTDIQAIGEIGLDYHHIRENEWRKKQENLFTTLLELAGELDMPVALHTRDAEKRAMEIVADYDLPVIQHCFNGSPALAEECVDRGYWVSVSTQVLYSTRVHEIAEGVPLEHILLETDAPFLYHGERNVPWHVEESAAKIADIKGITVEEVVQRTTQNATDALAL